MRSSDKYFGDIDSAHISEYVDQMPLIEAVGQKLKAITKDFLKNWLKPQNLWNPMSHYCWYMADHGIVHITDLLILANRMYEDSKDALELKDGEYFLLILAICFHDISLYREIYHPSSNEDIEAIKSYFRGVKGLYEDALYPPIENANIWTITNNRWVREFHPLLTKYLLREKPQDIKYYSSIEEGIGENFGKILGEVCYYHWRKVDLPGDKQDSFDFKNETYEVNVSCLAGLLRLLDGCDQSKRRLATRRIAKIQRDMRNTEISRDMEPLGLNDDEKKKLRGVKKATRDRIVNEIAKAMIDKKQNITEKEKRYIKEDIEEICLMIIQPEFLRYKEYIEDVYFKDGKIIVLPNIPRGSGLAEKEIGKACEDILKEILSCREVKGFPYSKDSVVVEYNQRASLSVRVTDSRVTVQFTGQNRLKKDLDYRLLQAQQESIFSVLVRPIPIELPIFSEPIKTDADLVKTIQEGRLSGFLKLPIIATMDWSDFKKNLFAELYCDSGWGRITTQYNFIFIEGESGIGKSTFLIQWLDTYLSSESSDSKDTVIFVNPKALRRNKTIEENVERFKVAIQETVDEGNHPPFLFVIDELCRPDDSSDQIVEYVKILEKVAESIPNFKIITTLRLEDWKTIKSMQNLNTWKYYPLIPIRQNSEFRNMVTQYQSYYSVEFSTAVTVEDIVAKSKFDPSYVNELMSQYRDSMITEISQLFESRYHQVRNAMTPFLNDTCFPFIFLLLKKQNYYVSEFLLEFIVDSMSSDKSASAQKLQKLKDGAYLKKSPMVNSENVIVFQRFLLSDSWEEAIGKMLSPSEEDTILQEQYRRFSENEIHLRKVLLRRLSDQNQEALKALALCVDLARLDAATLDSVYNIFDKRKRKVDPVLTTMLGIRLARIAIDRAVREKKPQETDLALKFTPYGGIHYAIANVLKNSGLHGSRESLKKAIQDDKFKAYDSYTYTKALQQYINLLTEDLLIKSDVDCESNIYEIEKGYNTLLELNPEDLVALRGKAIFYEKMEDYDKADIYFEEAYNVDKTHLPTIIAYAEFLKKRGENCWGKNSMKAEKYFNKAEIFLEGAGAMLKKRPNRLQELIWRVTYTKFLMDWAHKIYKEEREQAIEMNERTEALFNEAELESPEDMKGKEFGRYINFMNNHALFLITVAPSIPGHDRKSDIKRAEEILNSTLTITQGKGKGQKDPVALHILAKHMASQKDFPKAERLFKKSMENARNEKHKWVCCHELGKLYMHMQLKSTNKEKGKEHLEEARKYLKKALPKDNNGKLLITSSTRVHVCMVTTTLLRVYELLGNREEMRSLSEANEALYDNLSEHQQYEIIFYATDKEMDKEMQPALKQARADPTKVLEILEIIEKVTKPYEKVATRADNPFGYFKKAQIYEKFTGLLFKENNPNMQTAIQPILEEALALYEKYTQSSSLTARDFACVRNALHQKKDGPKLKNKSLREIAQKLQIKCSWNAVCKTPEEQRQALPKNKKRYCKNYGDYAEDLMKIKYYQQAIKQFGEADKCYVKLNLNEQELNKTVNWMYGKIGKCYFRENKQEKAQEWYEKARDAEICLNLQHRLYGFSIYFDREISLYNRRGLSSDDKEEIVDKPLLENLLKYKNENIEESEKSAIIYCIAQLYLQLGKAIFSKKRIVLDWENLGFSDANSSPNLQSEVLVSKGLEYLESYVDLGLYDVKPWNKEDKRKIIEKKGIIKDWEIFKKYDVNPWNEKDERKIIEKEGIIKDWEIFKKGVSEKEKYKHLKEILEKESREKRWVKDTRWYEKTSKKIENFSKLQVSNHKLLWELQIFFLRRFNKWRSFVLVVRLLEKSGRSDKAIDLYKELLKWDKVPELWKNAINIKIRWLELKALLSKRGIANN